MGEVVDDAEQLQLFGAGPGPVREVVLTVRMPAPKQFGSVHILATTAMRKQPMGILVEGLEVDQMATTIGYMIPLVVKAHYVNAITLRRLFWLVFRQFGIAGREAAIQGCGKP